MTPRTNGTIGTCLHMFTYQMPNFYTKENEDVEGHLLHSNDLMNSQGIVKDAKCGRFCLTLGGDANLWHESITPVSNDGNNL